jgi:hypothetical protein
LQGKESMIDATDKAAHQAHVQACWRRIVQDLARQGLTDKDVAGLGTEADVHDNEITGWTFEVKLTGERSSLRYHLDNRPEAEITLNGEPLPQLGEA